MLRKQFLGSLERCVFFEHWGKPTASIPTSLPLLGPSPWGITLGQVQVSVDSLDPLAHAFHPRALWVRPWPLRIIGLVPWSSVDLRFPLHALRHYILPSQGVHWDSVLGTTSRKVISLFYLVVFSHCDINTVTKCFGHIRSIRELRPYTEGRPGTHGKCYCWWWIRAQSQWYIVYVKY